MSETVCVSNAGSALLSKYEKNDKPCGLLSPTQSTRPVVSSYWPVTVRQIFSLLMNGFPRKVTTILKW
jgi:hypothetical protein